MIPRWLFEMMTKDRLNSAVYNPEFDQRDKISAKEERVQAPYPGDGEILPEKYSLTQRSNYDPTQKCDRR